MKYYDKSPYDEDITRDEETRAMEELIRGRVGTESPFKVPEGYFDRLPDLLMEKIDSEEQQADDSTRRSGRTVAWLGSHRKHMWWAAACVIAAVMAIGFQTDFTGDSVGKASSGMANVKVIHKQETGRSTNTEARHSQDDMQHITTIGNDAYVDEVADYAMMDNADIIACLDE